MALLKDSDLFPFDRYREQLAETAAAALSLAQSTEASAARMRTAYDGTQAQLTQIIQSINAVSTANAKTAADKFRSYDEELDKLGKSAEKYRTLLKQMDEAQSASGFSIVQLTKLINGLEKEYKALNPEQADFAARQKEIGDKVRAVSSVLNAQNQVLRDAKRATDAAEGSYAKLSKQTNDLRQTLRQMPGAFDEETGAINRNNKAAMEMLAIIQKNDAALKTADATMGQHGRSVGNYGAALKGIGSQALMASASLLGVSSAFDAIVAGVGIIADMERLDAGLRAVSRDTDDFNRSQQFLINTSDELGVRYDGLVKSFKLLKAATKDTSLEGEATEHIFHAVAEAGARLQLSNEEVSGTLLALTQMISKGHIQAEELRQQLGERLPGAMKLMAAATGVSERELDKMMQKGQLLAVDVLPQFAKELDKIYGGDAQGKINTMTAGWNRLTNEAQLFIASFNENKKVGTFFGTIATGIAGVFKDLRTLVKSDEWGLFMQYLTGGAGLASSAAAGIRAMEDRAAADEKKFRALPLAERQKQTGAAFNKKIDLQNQLSAAKNDASTDGNDAIKANLERELVKANARYAFLTKVSKDQATADARIEAAKVKEKADADKAKAEAEEKKRTAEQRKADAAARKALADSLSKSKAGTDSKLADLSDDKQNGLIDEQTFIEKRQQITQAGLLERQKLLEKAGQKETDDYINVLKEKQKADTEYNRAQLQLDLKTNKSNTDSKVSALDPSDFEGGTNDLSYIEQRHNIIKAGFEQEKAILKEAGQENSELTNKTNQALLDEDADYHRKRLVAQKAAWAKEVAEVKSALRQVSVDAANELDEQLQDLDSFYRKKAIAIEVDVKSGKMKRPEGEAKLYALELEHLSARMTAIKGASAKEQQITDDLYNAERNKLIQFAADESNSLTEREAAKRSIADLEKARQIKDAEDKKALDKAVGQNEKDVDDATKKHKFDNADKLKRKNEELMQMSLQLAGTLGDATFSIISSNTERESQALDKQHENELKLAGDNADAKQRIDEQYNKRKAELARKQAITEREQALFSVAINTAMGVASVLSTGGGTRYADFGISAGILSAFVIAAGIAQSAAILAKPLPAYKDGKLATDNYSGPALAGEAGAELFVDREGYSQLLTRPTIINTRPGDRIYTASETANLLDEAKNYSSAASRLQQGRLNEQVIIHQLAGSSASSLSKKDVYDAFGKALDERPVHEERTDWESIRRGMRQKNSYTEYRDKQTRL
ncbi:hypothetical protein GCM10028818_40910 [Spirosoma horti]